MVLLRKILDCEFVVYKLLVFSQFLTTMDVIEEFLTMENPDFISRKHVNTTEVEFFTQFGVLLKRQTYQNFNARGHQHRLFLSGRVNYFGTKF